MRAPGTKRCLADFLKTAVGVLIALWVAEVALNIGVVVKMLMGRPLSATMLEYIGLLIGDTQLALVVAAAAWLAAPVVGYLTGSREPFREAMALAGGALAAALLTCSFRFHWGFLILPVVQSLVVGVVAGAVVWVVLRVWAARLRTDLSAFGVMTAFLLIPALILGFASLILSRALHGLVLQSLLNAACLTVVVTLLIVALRAKKKILRDVALALPAVLVVLAAAHSVLTFVSYGRAVDAPERESEPGLPNIVLIVLDTTRADHLRRYGYARNTMPVLERWADGAIVFKRAVSSGAWTTPSHASIFSGQPVSLHGIHSGATENTYYTRSFPGIRWLPQELAARGYYSLAVSDNLLAVPRDIGFDRLLVPSRREFLWKTAAGAVDDHVLPFLRKINAMLRWRMPYVGADKIVDIVTRAMPEHDGPVFLFVNFLDPHGPYNPPAAALASLGLNPPPLFNRYISQRQLARLWPSLPEGRDQCLNDLYDGELRGLDQHLGRLLNWVDERLGEDSIVIVTSDHGEALGEDGIIGHVSGVTQAVVHVPLMVRIPGQPPGEIDEVVGNRMLYHLIMEAAQGGRPDVDALVQGDERGVISERYRALGTVARDGHEYDRAWIALFERDLKVVGPTEYGVDVFDQSRGFDDKVTREKDVQSDSLATRIDEYWSNHRDPRDDTKMEKLSEGEMNRLRSLGYVQ